MANWIAAAMDGFSAVSVRAVVHAACSSPSAIHRLPSLTTLLTGVRSNPPIGVRTAQAADLASWLMVPTAVQPGYQRVEDWIPFDARKQLRVEWSGQVWPIHPGLFERPWEVFARLRRFAPAVDPVLLDMIGFGIGDLTELALRIMGLERTLLSPHWSLPPVSHPTAPAQITDGEVAAAARLHELWSEPASAIPEILLSYRDTVRSDEHTERLARCLRWATPEPTGTPQDHSTKEPIWLTALTMTTKDGRVPLPGGLVPGALGNLAGRLVAMAAREDRKRSHRPTSDDPRGGLACADRVRLGTEILVVHALRGLPAHALCGVDVLGGRSGHPLIILVSGARHLIVVDIVATLDESRVRADIRAAKRRVAAVRPGSHVRLAPYFPPDQPPDLTHEELPFDHEVLHGQPGKIGADVSITRVVLVGGLYKPQEEFRPGTIVLGIDEWRDFVSQAENTDQFWSFLDELSSLPGIERLTTWDVRDVWAAFREHGLLHRAGNDKVQLAVIPRVSRTEWEQAVEADPFLDLTHPLELPPLREWPSWTLHPNRQATAGMLNPYQYLSFSADGTFVVALRNAQSGPDRQLVVALTDALYLGLEKLLTDPAETARRRLLPNRPIMISLTPTTALDDDQPIRFAGIIADQPLVIYNLAAITNTDVAALHRHCGQAIADAGAILAALGEMPDPPDDEILDIDQTISGSATAVEIRDSIIRRWNSYPSDLRLVHERTPFTNTGGAGFGPLTDGGRARAFRALAQVLRRRDVRTEALTGDAAVRLIRGELVPGLLSLLDHEVGWLDLDHALPAAAAFVEHTWAAHRRRDSRRALIGSADDSGLVDSALEDTATWRASNLVVEHMMTKTPNGASRLDERDWRRLVDIAALALELAGLADAEAVGFQDVTAQVLTDGVVSVWSGEPRANMAALQRERLRVHLAQQADVLESEPLSNEASTSHAEQPFTPLRSLLHAALENGGKEESIRRHTELMLDVENAMRTTLGFDSDALLAVLQTTASWPVTEAPIIEVTLTDLARSASDWSSVPLIEITAAIRALTLDSQRLKTSGLDFWNVERRQDRLATRPLIGLSAIGRPERLLLLPRQAAASQQIFANYRIAARLPWPHRSLPPELKASLAELARFRQRQFEHEVTEAARRQGLRHLRPGLLKAKAAKHGLDIPGEIDLLAADIRTKQLWVIEAKNTQPPFSIDYTFYDLRDFHGARDNTRTHAKQRKAPEKAYVGKLLAKTAAVRSQLAAALNATGVDTNPEGWTVLAVMVTPDPSVAAFVNEPRVPFARVAGLERLLSGETPPIPGFISS
ncbi:hypothetical protein ACFQ68_16685 [Amycolatopsis japonica]|uniref:hypothetical protein n=1 Tax=Amycolatopsis japonica TaxID=208439 RepID=UPI0036703D3E